MQILSEINRGINTAKMLNIITDQIDPTIINIKVAMKHNEALDLAMIMNNRCKRIENYPYFRDLEKKDISLENKEEIIE